MEQKERNEKRAVLYARRVVSRTHAARRNVCVAINQKSRDG